MILLANFKDGLLKDFAIEIAVFTFLAVSGFAFKRYFWRERKNKNKILSELCKTRKLHEAGKYQFEGIYSDRLSNKIDVPEDQVWEVINKTRDLINVKKVQKPEGHKWLLTLTDKGYYLFKNRI